MLVSPARNHRSSWMMDLRCSFLVVTSGKPSSSAKRIWWPKTLSVPVPVRVVLARAVAQHAVQEIEILLHGRLPPATGPRTQDDTDGPAPPSPTARPDARAAAMPPPPGAVDEGPSSRHPPCNRRGACVGSALSSVPRAEACAGVAQLVRAPVCGTGGRWFEPTHLYQINQRLSIEGQVTQKSQVSKKSAAGKLLRLKSATPSSLAPLT